jgi:Malectin domain
MNLDMPLSNRRATEREALDRLLASGVFARSPNLEKILCYLCGKYFSDQASLIKEYHVATEALGRPESFDPKKDSIVRVEMHRLRRRLREHYASAAAGGDSLYIEVPEKSYLVEFREKSAGPPAAIPPQEAHVEETAAPPLVSPEALPPETTAGRWVWPAILLLGATTGLLWWYSRDPQPPSVQAGAAAKATDQPPDPALASRLTGETVRILAGRPPGRFTDRFGQVWEADRYYSGGTAVSVSAEVATRGFDVNVFSSMRVGNFSYDIPLKPGTYELLMIFAETEYGERNPLGGGEASRIFSISANGKVVIPAFEAIADASEPNTATARMVRDVSPAADGKLHLRFGPATNGQPFLNAMVIRPGIAGKMRPIRIVCRPEPFRDAAGNEWESDHFYRAGKQISRPQGAPTQDGEVFRGERYGNFSYEIPVPPGRYGARLFFWDYWWGEGHPGAGGVGSRVFDVFGNHKPLLISFDIIRQNPREQFMVQAFHGFEPNPQGKIVFDFVSKVNYAQLNAIEVFDESKN